MTKKELRLANLKSAHTANTKREATPWFYKAKPINTHLVGPLMGIAAANLHVSMDSSLVLPFVAWCFCSGTRGTNRSKCSNISVKDN